MLSRLTVQMHRLWILAETLLHGEDGNGDSWFLGREPTDVHALIMHQLNAPSGARLSHIELGEFLRRGNADQQALLRLIATLVEVPPFAEGGADPPT